MVRRMDLKEKLRQFERDFRPEERPSVVHTRGDIDQYLNGQEVVNKFGRCFRVQTDYSLETIHGDISLDQFSQSDSDIFRFVGKDERLKGMDKEAYIKDQLEKHCCIASDAMFPYRDGIDAIADFGVKNVIQPGGANKDADVIKAANEYGMAMVHTGGRHFLH